MKQERLEAFKLMSVERELVDLVKIDHVLEALVSVELKRLVAD